MKITSIPSKQFSFYNFNRKGLQFLNEPTKLSRLQHTQMLLKKPLKKMVAIDKCSLGYYRLVNMGPTAKMRSTKVAVKGIDAVLQ